MTAPILILAAGASTRMKGEDKLLRPVGGVPLLRDRAMTALNTGQTVVAALPPRDETPRRWSALEGLDTVRVAVADRGEGMAAAIRAGIAALPETARAVVVVLADMPGITTDDLNSLIAVQDGRSILRGATGAGQPGHPVLFPSSMFGALSDLTGDRGARDLLQNRDDVRLVRLPGDHAVLDLDTVADWAAWSALP